jgi:hypothetical protein
MKHSRAEATLRKTVSIVSTPTNGKRRDNVAAQPSLMLMRLIRLIAFPCYLVLSTTT